MSSAASGSELRSSRRSTSSRTAPTRSGSLDPEGGEGGSVGGVHLARRGGAEAQVAQQAHIYNPVYQHHLAQTMQAAADATFRKELARAFGRVTCPSPAPDPARLALGRTAQDAFAGDFRFELLVAIQAILDQPVAHSAPCLDIDALVMALDARAALGRRWHIAWHPKTRSRHVRPPAHPAAPAAARAAAGRRLRARRRLRNNLEHPCQRFLTFERLLLLLHGNTQI